MIKEKKYSIVFIFFLVIISLNYFGFNASAEFKPYLSYLQFIYIAIAILISLPWFFVNKGGFIFPIQLISLSMIISFFMAYYSWGQGVVDSIRATLPFMLWFFFFYLLYIKISIKIIERIVIFYGVLYIIFYFFQLINYKIVYFGWSEEFKVDRGIVRIIFPGVGMFFLSIFIALNKFTTKQNPRWFWFILLILGILIPILQVTRQLIASVLIIYLFHFIKKQNIIRKVIILSLSACLFIIVINSDITVIHGLKKEQKATSDLGIKNIRVLAGNYFINNFSPNVESKIFGNGVPFSDKSDYGKFNKNILQNSNGFYLEDVGIISVYAMFGIFGVIGFIIIWSKSFIYPLPENYYYLKYYLWYLLFTCLTSNSVYHYDFLIATILALYCYQVVYNLENRKTKLIEYINSHKYKI